MNNPRQYTNEETREEFLKYMWNLIDYWDKETPHRNTREKLTGLMHSVLATLDGCACASPGFLVIPCPHKDDKQFNIDNGENWYPPVDDKLKEHDIGGSLHELYYNYETK